MPNVTQLDAAVRLFLSEKSNRSDTRIILNGSHCASPEAISFDEIMRSVILSSFGEVEETSLETDIAHPAIECAHGLRRVGEVKEGRRLCVEGRWRRNLLSEGERQPRDDDLPISTEKAMMGRDDDLPIPTEKAMMGRDDGLPISTEKAMMGRDDDLPISTEKAMMGRDDDLPIPTEKAMMGRDDDLPIPTEKAMMG
ncbi:hypothetical protein BLNAU_5161 [Blattamonas nauphoetae]|uniref:Uncharacterized protein n=1 Tax=Blattamonas nauphoetae TaxID=2049346 RepID=A0ABQ9Y8D6_9EUKA|nr:hypothetical protein BLNAU_5161 [Blattamonas nauphoetae]